MLRRSSIALSLWLVATAGAAAPQAQGDRSSLWTLPVLRGRLINVSYSAGSLDRAARTQRKYEVLSEQVYGWTDRKIPLALYVLSREEWDRVGFGLPFGFPARLPMGILALPARGDEGTIELWRGLLVEMDTAADLPDFQRGGPEQEASLRVSDLLGQLEATRILLEGANLAGSELWVSEVLTHSVLLSAWLRSGGAEADQMERLRTALRPPKSPGLDLDDYRPGVSMSDWLTFQAAFHGGARRLTDKLGPKAGKVLVKMTRKADGRLTGEALVKRFPELGDWRRATFP